MDPPVLDDTTVVERPLMKVVSRSVLVVVIGALLVDPGPDLVFADVAFLFFSPRARFAAGVRGLGGTPPGVLIREEIGGFPVNIIKT